MSGYKTYLVAAIGVIMTGLLGLGYLSQQQYDVIIGILGALGLAALRNAVK